METLTDMLIRYETDLKTAFYALNRTMHNDSVVDADLAKLEYMRDSVFELGRINFAWKD